MKNTPIIDLNYSLSKKTLTYRSFSYPRFLKKELDVIVKTKIYDRIRLRSADRKVGKNVLIKFERKDSERVYQYKIHFVD